MKKMFRQLFSLLLALLLTFSLTPSLAEHTLAELGAALLAAQTDHDAYLAEYTELTKEVSELETQYNKAGKKQKASLEEKWMQAMLDQEAAYEGLVDAEERLTSLQSEHQALLLLVLEEDCEPLTLDYDGRFADLRLNVVLDEDLVIYALTAEVDGSERDQLVAQNSFLYQFIGKDLPLTIGNGKTDDVRPLSDAQQTSKDLVAALNSLVYDGDESEKASSSGQKKDEGPIIEPQAIADYIFEHGKLPDNFITKKEAQKRGWDSRENYVSDVAPGYSIGGDRFGNYEGLLPSKKGRTWYEADCYYTRGKRNAYRILFSSDGLVYYTDDHYESFTQMHPSK